MIKVFDKVIPQAYADQIEEDLTRTQFPWYYIKDITNISYGNNSGLVHVAYDHGSMPTEWYPFVKPLVYGIAEAAGHNIAQLLRIRVGFLYPTMDSTGHNTPHIDFNFPHYTACYYVNDSDGDTVVFNEHATAVGNSLTEQTLKEYVEKTKFTIAESCSPKKGRVCLFDGYLFHASTKPKLNERRLVITINYVAE